MFKRIKRWWEGDIPPNEHYENISFFNTVPIKSKSSNIAHKIWEYLKINHRWIIGFIVTIIGLILYGEII